MRHRRTEVVLALALMLAGSLASVRASAQAAGPNDAPNPYHMLDSWAQIPQDHALGAPIGVEIDHSDGKSLWVFDRCGGNDCKGSKLAPIWKFDASGQLKANFGAGMFNGDARWLDIAVDGGQFTVTVDGQEISSPLGTAVELPAETRS